MFRYKYGQIDAYVDSFNVNVDNTIILIIMRDSGNGGIGNNRIAE